MHRVLVILLAAAIVCNQGARAGELSIAAASDLVFCLEDLNRAFAKEHPDITLKFTTGASGNIFAQINNGAPFPKGRWIEVPEHAYPRLEQGAVITKAGTTNPASAAYIEFLASPEARRIFDRFGFRLPE